MNTTGIVYKPFLRFSNSSPSGLSNYDSHLGGVGDSRVSLRPKNCFGKLTSQFSESSHLNYYVSKKKNTGQSCCCEIKEVKKKLKLIKRLSKDLSMFCHVAIGEETRNSLLGEIYGTEDTLVLLGRVRQFKLEQKELMRKMKEEKAQLKATSMKAKAKRESSSSSSSSTSSSSESSDSECGEVIDMNRLRTKTSALERIRCSNPQAAFREAATVAANPTMPIQLENSEEILAIGDSSFEHCREDCCSRAESECSSSNGCSNDQKNAIVEGASAKKIEICMGVKCKKLGAVALLEEFERKVGVEGAVVGCKCMGKCRDGPNVRVLIFPNEFKLKVWGILLELQAIPIALVLV